MDLQEHWFVEDDTDPDLRDGVILISVIAWWHMLEEEGGS
jgi:hypothetical protein